MLVEKKIVLEKLKLYKLLTNFINIPPTYFENNQLRNYIFPHLNNKQDLVNENVDSSKKRKKSFKNPFEKKQKTDDEISPQDDEISPVKTRSKKILTKTGGYHFTTKKPLNNSHWHHY